jgi:hypothetical protein
MGTLLIRTWRRHPMRLKSYLVELKMDKPVILITGALMGIGRATAVAFAQNGARLVVSERPILDQMAQGSARGQTRSTNRQAFLHLPPSVGGSVPVNPWSTASPKCSQPVIAADGHAMSFGETFTEHREPAL